MIHTYNTNPNGWKIVNPHDLTGDNSPAKTIDDNFNALSQITDTSGNADFNSAKFAKNFAGNTFIPPPIAYLGFGLTTASMSLNGVFDGQGNLTSTSNISDCDYSYNVSLAFVGSNWVITDNDGGGTALCAKIDSTDPSGTYVGQDDGISGTATITLTGCMVDPSGTLVSQSGAVFPCTTIRPDGRIITQNNIDLISGGALNVNYLANINSTGMGDISIDSGVISSDGHGNLVNNNGTYMGRGYVFVSSDGEPDTQMGLMVFDGTNLKLCVGITLADDGSFACPSAIGDYVPANIYCAQQSLYIKTTSDYCLLFGEHAWELKAYEDYYPGETMLAEKTTPGPDPFGTYLDTGNPTHTATLNAVWKTLAFATE